MKLKLMNLEFINFKGGKELINYADKTNITADNGVGKSRTNDAFHWLFFGKDSHDRSDFDIKPLNSNGAVIHEKDVEVSANILKDEKSHRLMKVFKEKWVKKRGAEHRELSGHTTVHYVDGLEVTKSDFELMISSIVDINKFKLLSNPKYFESLNWKEKRRILFSLIGDISDEDVVGLDDRFKELFESMGGRNLDSHKKGLQKTIRNLKEELKSIPARIDEVEKGKPQLLDFEALSKRAIELNFNLKEIEKQLQSESETHKVYHQKCIDIQNNIGDLNIQKLNRISELKTKLDSEPARLRGERTILLDNKNVLDQRLLALNDSLDYKKKRVEQITTKLDSLRENWYKVDKSQFEFDEDNAFCKTCSQVLPEDTILELKTNGSSKFNTEKVKSLENIDSEGKKLTKEKNDLIEQISNSKESIKNLKFEIEKNQNEQDSINNKLVSHSEKDYTFIINNDEIIFSIKEKIDTLKALMPKEPESNEELKQQKENLTHQIKTLEFDLNKKDIIAKADERIQELNDQIKQKSLRINELEKQEFIIEEFVKAKIEMVESKINEKFQNVQFKMYKDLINGGKEETCITLIDGVPYSSANNGGQICAGLDIIRTLSKHFDCYVPVVIDNREGVTEIPKMNTQLINLIVEKGQKTLKIETL